MFNKLLKYDLPAFRICSVSVGVSIPLLYLISVFLTRVRHDPFDIGTPVMILFISASVICSLVALAAPLFIALASYRRAVATDEAYMTFMLPVPRKLIVREKAIFNLMGCLLSDAVVLVSLAVATIVKRRLSGIGIILSLKYLSGLITDPYALAVIVMVPCLQILVYEAFAYRFTCQNTGNHRRSNKTTDVIVLVMIIIVVTNVLPAFIFYPIAIWVGYTSVKLREMTTQFHIDLYYRIFIWQFPVIMMMLSSALHVFTLDRVENRLNVQ